MEEVCQRLTKSLYQTFSNSNGKSEFALCRIFKSCSLGDFPPELKKHIRQKTNARIVKETKHIALLGTFGEKKEWCSISNSKNHKVLSLNNPNTIKNFPMMLALFNQIGFEITQNQDNGSLLFLKKEDHDFGLFLVKKAEGNTLIPDQEDFVIPLGIKSVFGFGGMFSTGNIFAAIIFSKKSIDINQAEIFHSLVPAFKFAQVENELKGRIFNGIKNNSGKNKISEKIELEIEKEKAATLNEELTRANKALLKLNEKLYRNNIKLNLTENKLTKSEERLQYALEASADGFWDWDIQTGKVFYSKKWLESLGYSQKEIKNNKDTWKKLVHPEDLPEVMAALQGHFEGKTDLYKVENRLLTKSGTYRWNQDRGMVVSRDKKGNPLRMVGTDTDITARKFVELALKQNEELLKNIINNTTGVIYLKNTHGQYILINHQFETLFNITDEEIKGKTDLDIFPRETAIKFMNNDKKVIERGTVIELEETVNHGNKLHTYISVKFPIRRENGDLFGVAGISTDITERKEAEKKLKSSLCLLSSIKNAQSKYIIESYSKQLFDELLDETLNLTQSEFGFIGEILKDQDGKPFLNTHTITNIAWNKVTRKLYDQNASLGMEFHNLDSLFGTVITTGKPVISNDPSNDPRSCGLPKGHPPLKSFLGLPFFHSGKMIGMVGMANRSEGYNKKLIDYLQPFLVTCSNLLQAWRNEQIRKNTELALKNRTIELGEKNLALKEILAQIEIEKNELIKTVSANVNKLLIPSLQKLARKATRVEQKYIDLLKRNLREITSGLGPNKFDTHLGLTPRELEVCNMVNGGLNTKEIASILNLSVRTVETHRLNIRKKLQPGTFEKP